MASRKRLEMEIQEIWKAGDAKLSSFIFIVSKMTVPIKTLPEGRFYMKPVFL